MKKEKLITITDYDRTEEKEEKTVMTTKGYMSGTDNDYKLEFDEIFDEGIESHTVMTVKGGSCVNLLRKGAINSELIIEMGKRHNCYYNTPYGDMLMGINATDVQSSRNSEGLKLSMSYTIDFYGNISAKRTLIVDIRDTNPEMTEVQI